MLPVIQVIELDETISPYKELSEGLSLRQLRPSRELGECRILAEAV